MTHTLIATNTLDACIRICPPRIHTKAKAYAQHNTQHTMSRVGRVGGQTQAPHKHVLIVELSAPPPFNVVVWVVGPLLILQMWAKYVQSRPSLVQALAPFCSS